MLLSVVLKQININQPRVTLRPVNYWIKLAIYFQTSSATPLEFGKGYVISSPTL